MSKPPFPAEPDWNDDSPQGRAIIELHRAGVAQAKRAKLEHSPSEEIVADVVAVIFKDE